MTKSAFVPGLSLELTQRCVHRLDLYERVRFGQYGARFRAELDIRTPQLQYDIVEKESSGFLPYVDLGVGTEMCLSRLGSISARVGIFGRAMVKGQEELYSSIVSQQSDTSYALYGYALNYNPKNRVRMFGDIGLRTLVFDRSWVVVGVNLSAQIPLGRDQVEYALGLVGSDELDYEGSTGSFSDFAINAAITFSFKRQPR
jgi:hypothetical protein